MASRDGLIDVLSPPALARAMPTPSDADASEMRAALSGARILVVEDEALVAMEFEILLEENGCEVIGPAPSIAAALRLIEEEQPDAALLDVTLMDGQSTPVAGALRNRNTPFVVVTGYNLDQLREAAYAGAPWVPKPADYGKLLNSLVHLLND